MRTSTLFLVVMLALVLMLGCNEAEKGIKPLASFLAELPQNWKDAYGDTIETRMLYNIANNRGTMIRNDMTIARVVEGLYKSDDPNAITAVTLDERVKALEEKDDGVDISTDRLEELIWKILPNEMN